MLDLRCAITPAPDPVPPAPLRGESFVLADGRTYIIPPLLLSQIHGPCARAFSVVINILAAEQWGIAMAVKDLTQHVFILVHQAMLRNYLLPMQCEASQALEPSDTPSCGACVACLLDRESSLTVLKWMTEVSGWRELLQAVGHTPPSPTAESGTKPTIN